MVVMMIGLEALREGSRVALEMAMGLEALREDLVVAVEVATRLVAVRWRSEDGLSGGGEG